MSRFPRRSDRQPPRSACWLVIVIAAVFTAGGCAPSNSRSTSQNGTDESAAHDDDHHRPSHKPRDFPAALAALHERCSKLLKAPVPKSPDVQKEFDQTRDIVGWLPELAADSDLSRAEWDRVNEHSKKLSQSLEELARGGSADQDPRVSQQIEIDLHTLDDIVGRYPDLFGKAPAVQRASAKDNAQYVDHPRT
jgi:hypothetical protein